MWAELWSGSTKTERSQQPRRVILVAVPTLAGLLIFMLAPSLRAVNADCQHQVAKTIQGCTKLSIITENTARRLNIGVKSFEKRESVAGSTVYRGEWSVGRLCPS